MTRQIKRLVVLACLLSGGLFGQCVVLPAIPTPNLGLNTVQHNTCNWDVQYNQVSTRVDLMLSGFVGIPAINFLPITLSHNPSTGSTMYLNTSDSLMHLRNAAGVDTIFGAGGSAVWGGITGTLSAQTDLQAALNAKQSTGSYMTSVTGDATGSGPGAAALTFATVNSNVGTCGDATHVGQVTLNAKGLATACTPIVITGGSGNVINSGTPTAAQVAVWVDATHIQGVGALTKAQQFATTVYTDQANTFGAFLQNFAAGSLIMPKSAAAAPTVAGQIAYDTITNTYQVGNGTQTMAQAYFIGSPPTAGNCVIVGAGSYQISSISCPGGGNVSNTGTPTSGQLALWTNATTIQGLLALPAANFPAMIGDATNTAGSLTNVVGRINGTTVATALAADLSLRTTASAVSSWTALPNCLDTAGQHLNYNTTTHLYSCGTTSSGGGSITIGGNGTLTLVASVLDTINGVVPKLTNSEDIAGLWNANIGLDFTEQSDCASSGTIPAAGNLHLCADADGSLYSVNPGGTATVLGGGGSANQIVDTNGNFTVKSGTAVTSAVNGICGTNAATAGIPTMKACGADTNIELDLDGKGAGGIGIGGGADNHFYMGPNGSAFAGMYFSMHTGDLIHFSVTGVGDVGTISDAGNETIKFLTLSGTTANTCAVGTRGQFQYTASGAGVKDIVQVCAKDAADAYAYRTIY